MTEEKKPTGGFKTMTLSECSKFDHMQGIRNKLTGWGKICKLRQQMGVSRRARIRAKKGHVK